MVDTGRRPNFDNLATYRKMIGSDMSCWSGQHFDFVDSINYYFTNAFILFIVCEFIFCYVLIVGIVSVMVCVIVYLYQVYIFISFHV